jgi:hypothetical protein
MHHNDDVKNDQRPPHREWHGVHQPWGYRPHAFRWIGEEVVGINFIPIAREMHDWMMQRGRLTIASMADQNAIGGYTNPYTFSGVALVLVFGRVVNSWHDYTSTHTSDCGAVDAEVERLRLYNEVVLYVARICEVAIKQLLYCSQIAKSRYERKALGELLQSRCQSCRQENGREPHMVSLVGSLAHPFRLCLEFECCAMDHMALVNKLRNSQAAHSGIQALNIRGAQESKAELQKDGQEVLDGFLHMLSHLAKLEDRMLDDLAEKGAALKMLRRNGLPTVEANFRLMPGQSFPG